MRTRPARRTRLIAATGVAIAALALTACDDGEGTKDEGAANSTITSTTSTGATKDGTGTGTGTTAGDTAGTSGSSTGTGSRSKGSGTGSGTGSKTGVLCNGSNTKVTAQPLSSPVNHMLLTVTNTGTQNCDLTYYPVLRFDEMQWAPQAVAESHPQAVATLAPGESGYAGVMLSAADGSGQGGETGHKLTVAFQGKTPNSDGGASAMPSLPSKGVYYDSSLKVTYWLTNASDARSW